MIKRFQNKITESRKTLPIACVIALAIWIVYGLVQQHLWLPFLCFAISTFLMVELNNANSLIRIYSRMISCAFMAMICSSVYLFPSVKGGMIVVCAVLFYVLFFHSFQDKEATGRVFYAFFCVGLSSVLFVQSLFFVPLLLILLATNMTALSWRTFFASIFGLILPYWFLAGYYAYIGNFHDFIAHFVSIAEFGRVADISCVNTYQIITFAYVLICSIIGTVHFLRNSSKDKIRTQLIYEMFITINIATIAFIILQPQHFNILIRLAIISTSPLIGHFISLTNTKLTNIASIVLMVIALIIPIVTYFLGLWTPSLTF